MTVQTLEELYKLKFHLIYRYLLKIGCTREDAEDIVQNTFYKAISKMIHLETENPSSWLFKVAIHNYYDLCRKQKRHPILSNPTFVSTCTLLCYDSCR